MGQARGSLRALGLGAVLGLALGLGRAPLGFELAATPAVGAADALTWRAFALAAVALALGRFAGSRPNLIAIFCGAALAFTAHAALLADAWRFESALGPYLVFALCLLGAWLLRRREHALLGPEEADRLGLFERVGLLAGGAGVALTLEACARPLRLLAGVSSADESVLAAVLLLLFATGAAAFGPLLPQRARAGLCVLGLSLGALLCVESLRPLSLWSSREGLDTFLRVSPWNLDLSHQGLLSGDALLAARVWILPAFVLGAAAFWAERGPRLGWILFGAALCLALLPAVLAATPADEPAQAPALRVALGAILTGLGSALAALGRRAGRRGPRLATALGCSACAAAALFLPRVRVLPISPWETFAVEPELVLDTPAGLLTIESAFTGGRLVTLDRRHLTPAAALEAADEQYLRRAWTRVSDSARQAAERRVLLIGQLTPLRARILGELGATHIDRSAAWHLHMRQLELELFEGGALPQGRILAPEELASAGPWSLIVAPPIAGDAPIVRAEDPEQGPRVIWCRTDTALARRPWGEFVALASSGIEELTLAPFQPAGLEAGGSAALPAPWRRLSTRHFERESAARAACFARLARAAADGPRATLAEGLALHTAAQKRSSPFETHAEQIEIEPRAVALLCQAALAAQPDGFLRELWNGLAVTLSEKRELELIDRYVQPLAERWHPWWQLELVLAQTDLELLDPGPAAERLLRVVAERPLNLDLRMRCAQALSMAGRPAEAVQQLEAVDAVQPNRRDVRRRLAMELARLGDRRAGPLLEELLADDPDDEQLRAFQGSGPFPPPEARFMPHEGLDDQHDH